MDEQRELSKLVEDVQALNDPEEREAVTLGTERGSGVLRIRFTRSQILRDDLGRVDGLVGGGVTQRVVRDENGQATEIYTEREDIIPE